jgi:hypothetical protein
VLDRLAATGCNGQTVRLHRDLTTELLPGNRTET